VDGGGRTRFRRLLRAGTLQDLTAGDVAHLTEDLRIRTVVDLRLTDEAIREGSALSGIPMVRYGSGAGYLTAHGLSGGDLAALRAALVEP
jgi:hypothetical protein